MLWSVLKGLRRTARPLAASPSAGCTSVNKRAGKAGGVLNALPGSAVDHTSNANDLRCFEDGSFVEVCASHVLEHLGHKGEMQRALRGFDA